MSKRPTLGLIDDHAVVRKAISDLLKAMDEFNVLFDVETFEELDEKLQNNRNLDLLLLDIRMPDIDGYEVAKILRKKYPLVKMLAFTSETEGHAIARIIKAGASGFLSKSCTPAEMLLAIHTVLNGDTYMNQRDFNLFRETIQDTSSYFAKEKIEFTERECDYIKLACTSLTYKEIADKLNISHGSINNYRDAIFNRLGITTRQELAVYAVQNGILHI